MSEQPSSLAGRASRPAKTASSSPRTPGPGSSGPDAFILSVGGVLLFVVLMVVFVVRTLYPHA